MCGAESSFIWTRVNCELFWTLLALGSAEAANMTPEELRRIREIYEAASSMSVQRELFLEQECQGNTEMRNEVERLLRARTQVPDWLHQPLFDAASPFEAPPVRMEGRQLNGTGSSAKSAEEAWEWSTSANAVTAHSTSR